MDTIHIRDPIHGSIALNALELAVVESTAFQRLRGIKQLGFADHAFPGATHTRFAHSLGAMHMASLMFDSILPAETQSLLSVDTRQRFRQLLRLTVLVHDIGHAPLSHATESFMPERRQLDLDCFKSSVSGERATHEDYTALLALSPPLKDVIEDSCSKVGIEPPDIVHLIGDRFPQRAERLVDKGLNYGPLLRQLVGGELDADRMDYLKRDSFYTGVNYGNFDDQWILNNLSYHVRDGNVHLALSHRAIFAFEDFLLSRYHMFVSVYYHHSAIGLDAMLTRFLREERDSLKFPVTAAEYIPFDDVAFWSEIRRSQNPWAKRISARRLYRRILEVNDAEGMAAVQALSAELTRCGIDHFVSDDESVLSRYYQSSEAVAPIFIINQALGRVSPISSYSPVFERYKQPARLVRLYCHPRHVEDARRHLRSFVVQQDGEQLPLQWHPSSLA